MVHMVSVNYVTTTKLSPSGSCVLNQLGLVALCPGAQDMVLLSLKLAFHTLELLVSLKLGTEAIPVVSLAGVSGRCLS